MSEDIKHKDSLGRRSVLKALAGIPVLGALGFETFRKFNYDTQNDARREIMRKLGLDDLHLSVKKITKTEGDLIRVGIVGWGIRGPQLAKALGFVEKTKFERSLVQQQKRGSNSLKSQIEHGNFNVVITTTHR